MPFIVPGLQDLSDSLQAGGAVTAPGAGAAIATVAAPPAGTYLVTVSAGTGAGTPVAADVGNMQLKKGATVVALLAHPISTTAPMPPVRVTLDGSTALTVNAVGVATAGVVYVATIVAVRVA